MSTLWEPGPGGCVLGDGAAGGTGRARTAAIHGQQGPGTGWSLRGAALQLLGCGAGQPGRMFTSECSQGDSGMWPGLGTLAWRLAVHETTKVRCGGEESQAQYTGCWQGKLTETEPREGGPGRGAAAGLRRVHAGAGTPAPAARPGVRRQPPALTRAHLHALSRNFWALPVSPHLRGKNRALESRGRLRTSRAQPMLPASEGAQGCSSRALLGPRGAAPQASLGGEPAPPTRPQHGARYWSAP